MFAGVFYCLFPQFTKEQEIIAKQIGGDYPALIIPDCLQMYTLFLILLLIMAFCIFLY